MATFNADMSSTHISFWNVRVLAVPRVVLCVLFDLLLQTCSIRPLILIHPNPVPEEQERWCGWDVVGCCCRLRKRDMVLEKSALVWFKKRIKISSSPQQDSLNVIWKIRLLDPNAGLENNLAFLGNFLMTPHTQLWNLIDILVSSNSHLSNSH